MYVCTHVYKNKNTIKLTHICTYIYTPSVLRPTVRQHCDETNTLHLNSIVVSNQKYEVATMSRLPKTIGLIRKRAL